MKILVDQNISHRIIPKLKIFFNEISHVKEFGLIYASDLEIFKFLNLTSSKQLLQWT